MGLESRVGEWMKRDQGATASDIAAGVGRPVGEVAAIMRRFRDGILVSGSGDGGGRRSAVRAERREIAAAEYRGGATQMQIASLLEVSQAEVWRLLKEAGVPSRPRGPRKGGPK